MRPGPYRMLLDERLAGLDASEPNVVYRAGGHRSSIAAGRMGMAGFGAVSHLVGGYDAWAVANEPIGAVD